MARIAGPAIAGVLIALVGLASCFFANAVSYVVCIVAFLLLRRGEFLTPSPRPGPRARSARAWRMVWRTPAPAHARC